MVGRNYDCNSCAYQSGGVVRERTVIVASKLDNVIFFEIMLERP